jgi:ABC-2 type transport system permease protein
MTGWRQIWVVATREVRERGRSRSYLIALALMVVVVVAAIVVPPLLENNDSRNVGLTGRTPAGLATAIEAQGRDVGGAVVRVREFDTVAGGEAAVRSGAVDVLVVDASRLEWQRRADSRLQAVVTGAIQLLTVRDRAAAAGVDPDTLARVLAPVQVGNVELGQVAGRSPGDETAALAMTVLLLMVISTYGGMVLSGVVEEKSSRVVEVLLARLPARKLLAGKITGIGLLGLAQVTVTAVAALVASVLVDSVDLPAVRGAVLAWAVVWFVLGFALYATAFGALGSLASRAEDAQGVAGPATVVLVASYFASFAAIGSPRSGWAQAASYLPVTAPMAMPNRVAMGATSWWEPVVAAAVAVATVGALVRLAGRVYVRAILHTGPTLKLREVWRGRAGGQGAEGQGAEGQGAVTSSGVESASQGSRVVALGAGARRREIAAMFAGVVLAVVVGVITRDVVIGVAVGALLVAAARTGMRHGHR